MPNSSVNGIGELLVYNNNVTNGMFSLTLLLIIFFISFLGMKTTNIPTDKTFIYSMLITTLTSYFFVAIPNFLSGYVAVLLTVITAAMLFFIRGEA